MTENDVFKIGTKYRYLLDKSNNRIIIFPSDQYGNTVSRKCYGKKELPLIDIRSKEIKEIISKADYLEVEVLTDSIVVHVYQGQEAGETGEIIPIISFEISKEALNLKNYDCIIGELLSEQELLLSNDAISNELNTVISVVSLFSGAGALDWPFSKDKNFQIVFANEINQAAAASYKENINIDVCCKDIRDAIGDIPCSDVVIGGVLCTPYAATNRSKKRMKEHKEYELLSWYIKAVKKAKAKVYAIENVPSFVSKEAGCLELLEQALPEYELSYRVVNDSYLGGFSTRKRVLLLGSRIGQIEIPDLEIFPKRTVREALSRVNSEWYNYSDITMPSESTRKRMMLIPPGGNYRCLPEYLRTKSVHSNVYRRLHLDLPSVAIPNYRKVNIIHPTECRGLSVAEASGINGNSKDFKYLGTLSARQQQAGNSVPFSLSLLLRSVIRKTFMNYYGISDKWNLSEA